MPEPKNIEDSLKEVLGEHAALHRRSGKRSEWYKTSIRTIYKAVKQLVDASNIIIDRYGGFDISQRLREKELTKEEISNISQLGIIEQTNLVSRRFELINIDMLRKKQLEHNNRTSSSYVNVMMTLPQFIDQDMKELLGPDIVVSHDYNDFKNYIYQGAIWLSGNDRTKGLDDGSMNTLPNKDIFMRMDNYSAAIQQIISDYCDVFDPNYDITNCTHVNALKLYLDKTLAPIYVKWAHNSRNFSDEIRSFNDTTRQIGYTFDVTQNSHSQIYDGIVQGIDNTFAQPDKRIEFYRSLIGDLRELASHNN